MKRTFFLCGNWRCHSLMYLYVKQSIYYPNKVEARLTLACRTSRLYGRYMIFRETVACFCFVLLMQKYGDIKILSIDLGRKVYK